MLVYYYDCCGRSMAVEIMAAKHVRDSRDVFVMFFMPEQFLRFVEVGRRRDSDFMTTPIIKVHNPKFITFSNFIFPRTLL